MSWLTKIALKKRWLTILIASIVTGISVWSLFNLHMELIPDIDLPVTSVITVYPQAKPEVIMNEVTGKVESAFDDFKDITLLQSTISEGTSVTFAMFGYGTNMKEVNRQLEENLAALELPSAVRDLPLSVPQLGSNPRLYAIDINMLPVVIFSMSGDLSTEELEQVALDKILPVLEDIDGVYEVSVEGGSSRQVLVEIDPQSLNAAGMPLSAVAGVLMGQSFASLEQLGNTPVSPAGTRLGDISSIELGYPQGSSISRIDGRTAITVSVMKEAEANTVTTANAVTEAMVELNAELPGVTLSVVMDQSEYIESTIGDLARDALIGCALAIVIVFLFLMAFRASLVTAISIPLSIILGFLIMRFFGITINLITLSAMAIAVGRVIDNSIVVLEVIYRRIQNGEPYRSAAIEGVKEVALPITSSTLATIVIFVPLAFVGGIVGELFVPFALTMGAALISSLLVALIVIPPLSDFTVGKKAGDENGETWYQRLYLGSLKWSLAHRAMTVIVTVVLFFGSFALVPVIGTSFLPDMGEKMLTVQVVVPDSLEIDDILEAAGKTEQVLLRHRDVTTVQTTVGTSGIMGLAGGSAGGMSASLRVMLDGKADIDATAEEVRRDLASAVPEVDASVTAGQAGASVIMGSGIDLSILGNSFDDIELAAEMLSAELESIDGITNLSVELASTEPKLDITPDMMKVMASGLSMEQLQGLQQEFYLMQVGAKVAAATVNGNIYEVHLSGIIPNLDNIETARALKVGYPVSVSLGDIATVKLEEQQTNIIRVDGKLSAGISATVTATDIGAINRAVQEKIDSLEFPDGVEITQGGVTEMMNDAFRDMAIAIIIAILLTFLVIAVTFRSLVTPVVIMVSLPLASIGALVALLIGGQTLGVLAMMGVLMLVGIVLTNAIVLIDLVERLRREGMETGEALLEAGKSRMRPILMTALTTMIAMLPLALGFGEGTIFSAELAIVVIGGLFSSTLLTLLVIPVIYSLMKKNKRNDTEVTPDKALNKG